MKEWEIVFSQDVFSLRNGRRLRFWLDAWCGEDAFCNSFPSLFALAPNKEALVAEMWESSREEGACSPSFT